MSKILAKLIKIFLSHPFITLKFAVLPSNPYRLEFCPNTYFNFTRLGFSDYGAPNINAWEFIFENVHKELFSNSNIYQGNLIISEVIYKFENHKLAMRTFSSPPPFNNSCIKKFSIQ